MTKKLTAVDPALTLKKVEAERLKAPEKSIKELCTAAKVTVGAYYRAKKKQSAGKVKYRRLKGQKPITVSTSAPERMVFMMGTPDQIREIVSSGAFQ